MTGPSGSSWAIVMRVRGVITIPTVHQAFGVDTAPILPDGWVRETIRLYHQPPPEPVSRQRILSASLGASRSLCRLTGGICAATSSGANRILLRRVSGIGPPGA